MKKIVFLFCLLFSFNVYALTLSESEEIAAVARGIIEKGMSKEHLDSKGMPILAYMQGEARVHGYNGELFKITNTYSGGIKVNSAKWNFDCSSFVSYIFKVTLGMKLLDSNYLGGNPYMVENFLSDNNFTKVYNRITESDLLSKKNNLLPGDLIVIIGSHIGMYVGSGEVAEASNKLIRSYQTSSKYYQGDGNYNLGTGISKLEDFVNGRDSGRYTVLRLNKTLQSGEKINTIITWPDTLKQEDFGTKDNLTINILNTDYTKNVEVELSLEKKKIAKYKINDGDYQAGNNLNKMTIEIKENGQYNILVIDESEREYTSKIDIKNIDTDVPEITKLECNGNILYVEASDSLSGLHDEAFSYDNGNTWTNKQENTINVSGKYVVLVRDKLGNISQKELTIILNEETHDIEKKSPDYSLIILIILGGIIGFGLWKGLRRKNEK